MSPTFYSWRLLLKVNAQSTSLLQSRHNVARLNLLWVEDNLETSHSNREFLDSIDVAEDSFNRSNATSAPHPFYIETQFARRFCVHFVSPHKR
jgi:hypothetical protein